jgi:hypothetical protein
MVVAYTGWRLVLNFKIIFKAFEFQKATDSWFAVAVLPRAKQTHMKEGQDPFFLCLCA